MAAERDPSPQLRREAHTQLCTRRYDKPQGNCWRRREPRSALSVVLKWVGVALLVVACLLVVYLGAAVLGDLAVRVTYP
jgi:type VI protein secretion system component VasF